MSGTWSWFIILGTLGTLLGAALFLFINRKTSGEETTGHEWDGIQELDNPLPFWWVGMFALSIVFALGYLAWYPGLGTFQGISEWSSDHQLQSDKASHDARFAPLYQNLASMTPTELSQSRVAQQVGRRLFINHCSTCHGVSARGTSGFPNLRDDDWIWGEGFKNIKFAIQHGRTAVMPALGPALGDQGVSDLIQFLLSLGGRDHGAQAADRGEKLYSFMCANCHGPEATGIAAMGAPNLTDQIWLYGGTAKDLAHTLNYGRMGHMPSFAEVLDEEKIHILAAYVNGLSQ